TAIRGFSDLLLFDHPNGKFGPLNEQQIEFLQNIERLSIQVWQIIEGIHDYAFVENGHLLVNSTVFSLQEEAKGTIASIQFEINKRSQILNVRIPDNLPPVEGSAWWLRRAMHHIFKNACYYTLNGGTIDINIEHLPVPNGYSDTDVIHVAT